VRVLHYGPGGQPVIALAFAAPQNVRTAGEPVWLAGFPAPLAYEPIAPADHL
jgi:hypothetical protein